MREMQDRLGADPELAAAYRAAHEAYLAPREAAAGRRAGDRRQSRAGGMPDRVKCLHVLVGARARRRAGREPARRRGPRGARGVVGRRAVRVGRGAAPNDPGRGDRLRHQLDPAAGRRPDAAADTLTDRLRRMEIVRLGQGVDRTGGSRRGAGAHVRRVRAYAGRLRARARRRAGPVRRHLRDPRRGEPGRLPRRVLRTLGVEPEVVTGARGGRAVLRRRGPRAARTPRRPVLVVDIGGGSTELVLGDRRRRGRVSAWTSARVRLTERHLHGDPPTAEQVAAAERDRHRRARRGARRDVPIGKRRTLVGARGHGHDGRRARPGAGPATTRAAIHHSRHPGRGRSRDTADGCCTCTRRRAGGDAGDAAGPGRRHRGRRAHPPACSSTRSAPSRSSSASTTSSTASPGRSSRRGEATERTRRPRGEGHQTGPCRPRSGR